MSRATKLLFATACGSAALALSALSASAGVVCSGDVCWHTKETLTYPPESRVIVREDSWKPGPTIKFREHEGRGYWKGDTWIEIK
jgi:hypothetical protein